MQRNAGQLQTHQVGQFLQRGDLGLLNEYLPQLLKRHIGLNRQDKIGALHEGAVSLYGKPYRAVVVHSSAHDQRRQKRLQRRVTASLEAMQTLAKSAQKRRYACRADAEKAAAEAIAQRCVYHQLKVHVHEYPRYGRGRPKDNAPRTPVALEYGLEIHIIEDSEALERARRAAGCFVLLSNVAVWSVGADGLEGTEDRRGKGARRRAGQGRAGGGLLARREA